MDATQGEMEENVTLQSTDPAQESLSEPSKETDGVIESEGVDENGNQEEEDLNLGDTSDFSVPERNRLFQRGTEYEKKKKLNSALQCYLGCIKGLKSRSGFVLLPQCLHNIADIYQEQMDYDRAIHFAKAEKLFYETALIETEDIQKKLEEVAGEEANEEAPKDLNELNWNVIRAEEYEHLAKLCLDNQQVQLALEYAGKCTKMRQQIYGEHHEKTTASLNFFASVYAEVGKSQYSDSINLLAQKDANKPSTVDSEIAFKAPEVVTSSLAGEEPVSILRQRSCDGEKVKVKDIGSEREKKQVRFHESVEDTIRHKKKEECVSMTITLLVLAVCVAILASLGMWLYCSIVRGSMCHSLNTQLHRWFRLIQYQIHRLMAPRLPT